MYNIMHIGFWLSQLFLKFWQIVVVLVTMSYSFETPWTVAHQLPGFSREEYWSGWPFPSPGDLPYPGIEPISPALAGGCFTTEPPGKPFGNLLYSFTCCLEQHGWTLSTLCWVRQVRQGKIRTVWYHSFVELKKEKFVKTESKWLLWGEDGCKIG